MKTHFRFSNLLGTVYKGGNLTFSADGDILFSPVGNKVTLFDLKNHRSETLPFDTLQNVVVVALCPSGRNIILVDERGRCLYANLLSRTILHRHRFGTQVQSIAFSPDGRWMAACCDMQVKLFRSARLDAPQLNPFYQESVFRAASDTTKCLHWSADSRLFAVGAADMQTRVCAAAPLKNVFMVQLGGHSSPVVACFFLNADSYDLVTLERRGFAVHWTANLSPAQVVSGAFQSKSASLKEERGDGEDESVVLLKYAKTQRHSLREACGGEVVSLTSAALARDRRLLASAFSSGAFLLHETPELVLIHSLSVSERSISAAALNVTADWLALGSADGQLLVWEWQSESYVMRQQSHADRLTCLAYSLDGAAIATGADDGKVKVWSGKSGFCTVTFAEHTAGVSAVVWTQASKAVLSASLDGSVRAFDLKRYRNFRTLASPVPAQLSCVDVDSSGEVVCAGARDLFDIFVWSLQNGRLLEVLSGHTSPVSAVCFSKAHSVLASVSWDKSLRTWDVFEGKGGIDVVALGAEGLDVQFAADGSHVAALTADSVISTFDWRANEQTGSIEAKRDLDPGRSLEDHITAAKSGASKSFTTMSHSDDGEFILVGGQSNHICLYHAKEQLLVKKYCVSTNVSLAGVARDVDRSRVSELGNVALVDESDSDDDGPSRRRPLRLPGARLTDFSRRRQGADIRVSAVRFSPTGSSWAAATTEGLLLYSLDSAVIFDPFRLSESVTPGAVVDAIREADFGRALLMALKLNDAKLIEDCVSATPLGDVVLLCGELPTIYAEKLLVWFGGEYGLATTMHYHFYLVWIKQLLYAHGPQLKLRSEENCAAFTALQQVISRRQSELSKICERNKYGLHYLYSMQPSAVVSGSKIDE